MRAKGPSPSFQVITGGNRSDSTDSAKSPITNKHMVAAKDIYTPDELSKLQINPKTLLPINRIFSVNPEKAHITVDTIKYGPLHYSKLSKIKLNDFHFPLSIQSLIEGLGDEWQVVSDFINTSSEDLLARSIANYLLGVICHPSYIAATRQSANWIGIANIHPNKLETLLDQRARLEAFQYIIGQSEDPAALQKVFPQLNIDPSDAYLFFEDAAALYLPESTLGFGMIDFGMDDY